ncbi:hypothetical protein NG825_02840 [Xanthomonas sacchari]|nr:hypothetical protein NG825_02840 [Xanthomonas sacchari]
MSHITPWIRVNPIHFSDAKNDVATGFGSLPSPNASPISIRAISKVGGFDIEYEYSSSEKTIVSRISRTTSVRYGYLSGKVYGVQYDANVPDVQTMVRVVSEAVDKMRGLGLDVSYKENLDMVVAVTRKAASALILMIKQRIGSQG